MFTSTIRGYLQNFNFDYIINNFVNLLCVGLQIEIRENFSKVWAFIQPFSNPPHTKQPASPKNGSVDIQGFSLKCTKRYCIIFYSKSRREYPYT